MNQEHFIAYFQDQLKPTDCKQLIQLCRKAPNRQAGRTGSGISPLHKESIDCSFSHAYWSSWLPKIQQAMLPGLLTYCQKYPSLVTGAMTPTICSPQTNEPVEVTVDNFHQHWRHQGYSLFQHFFELGSIQIQEYQQCQGNYRLWHSEIYPEASGTQALHRVLFIILYLNTVLDGGETEFLYQDVKVKPQEGSLLIAPAGFTHTHRGLIPNFEDKFILTSWLLYKPGSSIYKKSKEQSDHLETI